VDLKDKGDVPVHPYCASYSRTPIRTILGAEDGGKSLQGKSVVVGGWVKSGREQGGGAFSFIHLNDGSIFTDIQVYASYMHLQIMSVEW
jgi:asparaginyl-tRNA synthetase